MLQFSPDILFIGSTYTHFFLTTTIGCKQSLPFVLYIAQPAERSAKMHRIQTDQEHGGSSLSACSSPTAGRLSALTPSMTTQRSTYWLLASMQSCSRLNLRRAGWKAEGTGDDRHFFHRQMEPIFLTAARSRVFVETANALRGRSSEFWSAFACVHSSHAFFHAARPSICVCLNPRLNGYLNFSGAKANDG